MPLTFKEKSSAKDWKILQASGERLRHLRKKNVFPKTSEQDEFKGGTSSQSAVSSSSSKSSSSHSLLKLSETGNEESFSDSSCDPVHDDVSETLGEQYNEDVSREDDEASWEIISENSEDEAFENFLKRSRKDISKNKYSGNTFPKTKGLSKLCMPYTSLTDHLMAHYHPENPSESDSKDLKTTSEGFPMNVRVPLMQILDTLDDINKVLKVGHLTPRMERIMEYKQDHPFSDGYSHEKMGCCQWVLIKLEQTFKRFYETQWPN